MGNKQLDILFTDLDGTLLNSSRFVTRENRNCLEKLGEAGVVRVIATGRSHYSYTKLLNDQLPIDFLIFSSGAGIIDMRTGKLLYTTQFHPDDITHIADRLQQARVDFMVHQEIPENHKFTFSRQTVCNEDFDRRLKLYGSFAKDYLEEKQFPDPAAQVIAIFPNDPEQFAEVKHTLNGYQITRTTSPLDHNSIWMEIYPQNVHKGSAAAWLCNHLQVNPLNSIGLGNDYNDIELLDFTPTSYLMKNGPRELHDRYRISRCHNDDGFSYAVKDAGFTWQK